MGEAVGSLSGLLEKTDQEWMLVRHRLDKALKDTQHTVFLIQASFFFFFPPASPHATSMLLATVVGAVERSFVFGGFHVCAWGVTLHQA